MARPAKVPFAQLEAHSTSDRPRESGDPARHEREDENLGARLRGHERREWSRTIGAARAAALVLGLGAALTAGDLLGSGVFVPHAHAQSAAPSQAEALQAYNKALGDFKAVLKQRRGQIDAKQPLPERPGQALYLARNAMMSTYKDLTDAMPSRIGRANKFEIPPAYFDADNEPLIDEYLAIFAVMQAPPANAQKSETPFADIVALATAIGRAKGLSPADAEIAGRISLGLFFAETNGHQNMGNARSNKYKGSLQTGVEEDRNGQKKWAAIKQKVASFDPALIARDDKEEARLGKLDPRYNHWIAVRNGLMNAHADLFGQIPSIVKRLPDPIDQMKLFELIQIVPSPTRSALRSDNLTGYRVSDPTIMGYLRNNSMFTYGRADRAKTSANYREILDAMWLFNEKFEKALARFNEVKAQKRADRLHAQLALSPFVPAPSGNPACRAQ